MYILYRGPEWMVFFAVVWPWDLHPWGPWGPWSHCIIFHEFNPCSLSTHYPGAIEVANVWKLRMMQMPAQVMFTTDCRVSPLIKLPPNVGMGSNCSGPAVVTTEILMVQVMWNTSDDEVLPRSCWTGGGRNQIEGTTACEIDDPTSGNN